LDTGNSLTADTNGPFSMTVCNPLYTPFPPLLIPRTPGSYGCFALIVLAPVGTPGPESRLSRWALPLSTRTAVVNSLAWEACLPTCLAVSVAIACGHHTRPGRVRCRWFHACFPFLVVAHATNSAASLGRCQMSFSHRDSGLWFYPRRTYARALVAPDYLRLFEIRHLSPLVSVGAICPMIRSAAL